MISIRARRSASLVVAAALLVLTAACGGSGGPGGSAAAEASGEGSGPSTGGTGALSEPVTVEHEFGTTTIKKVPDRIVTLGRQWTDVMVAMGVTPVGYAHTQGMPESGAPWLDMPETVEVLSVTDGVPIEKVAALNPDLIVGSYLIADQETYRLLSGIAPTVARLGDGSEVPSWQELTKLAGKFMDKPDRAKEVIAGVEAKVSATAQELPGFQGETFVLAQYVVGDSLTLLTDSQDGASALFRQLGLKMYPPVKKLGDRSGNARVSVSTERADLLRADLVAFLINGGDKSDLADIPGFKTLPGTVAVLDFATIVGLNLPTPLSIPYALGKLRPSLEKVAGEADS